MTALLWVLGLISAAIRAQQVPLDKGSVVATIIGLKPGQYVWAPDVAPAGPMLLIVNVQSQRAVLYRNGIPIGATTVSTGRPGFETPTGVFTILQKQIEHYSSKYDNAPMPYMQRLTWQGVALHAGQLPGHAASHGCIRLPSDFARLLYGSTKLGMTVVIADKATTPRFVPGPAITQALEPTDGSAQNIDWHPEKSPTGPVSIIVSSTDKRAIVLRNGIAIGSAPVSVEGEMIGSWAYALRAVDKDGQHWIRMPLSGASDATPVSREEWQRFRAPEEFRHNVAGAVSPGSTVIVTTDLLQLDVSSQAVTIIESEIEHR